MDISEGQTPSKISVRIAVTNSVFMEDSEKNRYIEFLIQQKEERGRTTDYDDMLPMTIGLCKAV